MNDKKWRPFKFIKRIKNIHESSEQIRRKEKGILENIPFVNIRIKLITYEHVIDYFTKCKPLDKSISKMLVRYKQIEDGYLVTFFFLDDNEKVVLDKDGIIYGKQIISESIDEEFIQMIGDNKGIIIE